MQTLQNELSKIYPCEIKVHYINDALFANYKEWSGAYAVYYRLRVAEILDSNIKYVLSLECDMVVVGDIRGLFSIDMESKLAYVVHDYAFHTKKQIIHKNDKSNILTFDEHYFNAGFILFNLESCSKIGLWDKALNLLNNYKTDFAEQDIFNLILKGRVGILSPCFNYLSFTFGNYPIENASDENKHYDMNYTRGQLNCADKNAVIYHYTPYKPWENSFISNYPSYYNYKKVIKAVRLWENMAKITPVYANELQNVLNQIRQDEFDNYTIFIAEKLENMESKNKENLQILCKKTRKRMKMLLFGEVILLILLTITFCVNL